MKAFTLLEKLKDSLKLLTMLGKEKLIKKVKLLDSLTGFTIIQTLVVLGIIVILALLTMPYLRQYGPNLALQGVTRELFSNLRWAQELAISEQVIHGVYFLPAQKKYQVIRFTEISEEVLKEKTLPQDVDFESINGFLDNKVKYNSYGAVFESGEIILINTNNQTSTIDVRPSGYVRIAN